MTKKKIDIRDYAGEIVRAMQPWRQRSAPRQHMYLFSDWFQLASPPLSQRGGVGGGVCNEHVLPHFYNYSCIETPPLTLPFPNRSLKK